MTVNTGNIVTGPYVGNDIADSFSYDFRIENKTQIEVYQTVDGGVQTVLIVDTDYTVDTVGDDAGGTITRVAGALPTGYKWWFRSDYEQTQLTAFGSQGGFFPDIHEAAMDKMTFLIQQLQDESNRSIKVNVTSPVDPDELVESLLEAEINAVNAAASADADATQTALDRIATGEDVVATQAILDSVVTTGDTQVARVIDEGDTQVARVIDEGDTQVARVGDFVATFDTVDELTQTAGEASLTKACFVKDLVRGGSFVYDATKVGDDNQGTNFNGWVRQYVGNEINVDWFGAKVNTPLFDSSPSFKLAMAQLYLSGVADISEWPNTKRLALVGSSGDYYFGSGFITPDFSAPNYINYDIKMPNSVFKPLSSYDHSEHLIHAKACFEYVWEFGIHGFNGTGADYVIFNDSSREQNYGGKCTYRIKASDTDFVIRHELESVVANFEDCMTNMNVVKFLRVWRCDQAVINRCFFNWYQGGRSTYDSFIEWGKDEDFTNEPAYPGFGNYNVGRLTITNSMFVPGDGTVVPRVHTGWIENVGGVINIEETCHFGPESLNRPSIVLNRAVGATFLSTTDLTESGIHLNKCSCVSSWDLVYCISDYPNRITIENIRWNTLDNSNVGELTYLIGGDSAILNAKTTKYTGNSKQYFSFKCDAGNPANKSWMDVDPSLSFANEVTTHSEFGIGQPTFASLGSTGLIYDLTSLGTLMPSVPPSGVYEMSNSYSINASGEGKTVEAVSTHRLTIVKNGLDAELVVEEISAPGSSIIGAKPTMSATFINGAAGAVATAPRADIDSGVFFYIRISYSTNSGSNTFIAENFKIRRLS